MRLRGRTTRERSKSRLKDREREKVDTSYWYICRIFVLKEKNNAHRCRRWAGRSRRARSSCSLGLVVSFLPRKPRLPLPLLLPLVTGRDWRGNATASPARASTPTTTATTYTAASSSSTATSAAGRVAARGARARRSRTVRRRSGR